MEEYWLVTSNGHVTPHENPVIALTALGHDTSVDGYFAYQWAECWLHRDGKPVERQWRIVID